MVMKTRGSWPSARDTRRRSLRDSAEQAPLPPRTTPCGSMCSRARASRARGLRLEQGGAAGVSLPALLTAHQVSCRGLCNQQLPHAAEISGSMTDMNENRARPIHICI